MTYVTEGYSAKPLSASGNVFTGNGTLAGFLCTTSGTIDIKDGPGAGDTSILPEALAVTAGGFYNIPFSCDRGVYAVLAGGAHGTCFYSR